jgi:hypothetical protein
MKDLPNHLEIEKGNGPRSFSADIEGITFLKAQFLTKARKFFYLRKGEDVNAHLIAAIYGHSLNYNWDNISEQTTRDDAKALVEFAKNQCWFNQLDLDRERKISDYRIICISENKESDSERGEKINKHLGVDVMFIPSEQRHLYRLYLNDNSFAFFYRHGEGLTAKFYGYLGEDDPNMIQKWKVAFEEEWDMWKKLDKLTSGSNRSA